MARPLWIQWNCIFEGVFEDFIEKYKSDKWILTLKDPTSDNIYAGGEDWLAVAPKQPLRSTATAQRNNNQAVDVNQLTNSLMHLEIGRGRKSKPKTFVRHGKARFTCSQCRNSWTSMRACVLFYLWRGEVRVEIYGQKCKICSDEFEMPEWYSDEVERLLDFMHIKVGITYYSMKSAEEKVSKRVGKMKRPHQADLCQMCKSGNKH